MKNTQKAVVAIYVGSTVFTIFLQFKKIQQS